MIKDGEIQGEAMRRSRLTERDLIAALRVNAHLTNLEQVKQAYIERNGNISVIPAQRELQVIEVTVESGVQTVRIELS